MRSDTMERFAYTVATLDDLDPGIASAFPAQIAPDESIRQIVVAPRQRQLAARIGWRQWLARLLPWQWTPSWVLVLTSQRLLVAESAQPGTSSAFYAIPTSVLLSIELGVVLLVGWLTCTWVQDGRVANLQVDFNTVGHEHFRQILQALYRDLASASETPWCCSTNRLPPPMNVKVRKLPGKSSAH